MRISDWSSDVCSSDLLPNLSPRKHRGRNRDARTRTLDGSQGRRGAAAAMDCADAEGRALGGNCAYRHVLPPSKPFALSLSKGCSFSRRRRKNRASTGSARTAAGQSGIKRCTDMTTLVLHDYFRSSASYRVRIALNLKGLDYSRVEVSLIAGEQKGDAYLAQNAQGFVPMLVADGEPIIQSLAIIDWLDRAHPTPRLTPDDPMPRAVALRSQEHPSELQSLMRNSSAVFCLKKKN